MQQITIVVPTRNESENIEQLLSGLKEVCPNAEMLVVDDSDDNTSTLALRCGARVVKGKRKGLGQAILDGIQASKGDVVVVMDADGCLPEGTQIAIANPDLKNGKGHSCIDGKFVVQKSIKDINIGDKVLSYNETDGVKEWDTVTNVASQFKEDMLRLKLSNGNEIELTGNHSVFTHNRGWIQAEQLDIGDSLVQYRYKALALRIYNLPKRGKTYEQFYGTDKAKEVREKVGLATSLSYTTDSQRRRSQSKVIKSIWRDKKSTYNTKEYRKKHALAITGIPGKYKGKTYEEIYGVERAAWIKTFFRSVDMRQNYKEYAKLTGRHPNKSECRLGEVLDKVSPEEFKFNDGWFILEGRKPDYVNVNGKKKLIEFQGCYWHHCIECGFGTPEEQEEELILMKERAEAFARRGYDTKFIWGHELKDENAVKQSILDYIYNPNTEVVTIVDKISLETKARKVYDIGTAKNHNFFAYGILVHNSHRPQDVPRLLHPILRQGFDMVIGSRYVKSGKVVGWELSRRIVSRVACLLALPVTTIKDSTSGFFAFRKEIIKGVELKGTSWKIMLEIWAKAHPVAVKEVPITFCVRQAGKSKFNKQQMRAYLRHLWLLCLFKYQRFIKFCTVGASGAAITFFLTWLLTDIFGLFYLLSLVFAVGVATITNYTFNVLWTFKAERKIDSPDYEWNAFYQGNPIQRWWKQGIAKAIWKMLPREGKVLDLGSGSSPNCTYFKDVTVLDADAGKLATLKAKMPHISTIVGSACKLEFPDASFDSVTCIEVLEHLPSPKRAVEEIARVLKIGGKAVIATPDYSKKQWLLAEKFTSYRNGHVSRFTKTDLEMLCRRYKLVPRESKFILGCDLIELFEKVK